MVVCHCRAVNDALVRLCLDRDDLTVDDVTARCGAGGHCGGCRETIQALLDERRRRPLALAVTGASYSPNAR
jgi:bacterioferritin-associated ferredoxin